MTYSHVSTVVRPSRRRHAWWTLVLVLALAAASVLGADPHLPGAVAAENPVVVENRLPGTTSWQMGAPGTAVSNDATGQIKGYASATSVNKGGQVDFMVSVSPSQSFTADVYRTGYYGGTGARLVLQTGSIQGTKQRTCTPDPSNGLIECGWTPTYTLAVPASWTSGVYLVKLTNAQNYQNYITFVVRDDARTADLLYQQSVTTYQAYNNYPADGSTGKSLYEYNSYGPAVPSSGTPRAAKVSFDRPYSDEAGAGQYPAWEQYYVRWLESAGYDVSYSTDLDTHTSGSRLLDFKGFLSVGHDEYWSKAMLDAVTSARDSGVNLGFFGSNTAYWQVRFEPSSAGAANRIMVCYKSAAGDPVKDATSTGLWRDPPASRPEQGLVGVQYTAHLMNEGRGAMYVVKGSSNWVWAGTGVSDGTQIPGVLGYETDRLEAAYPPPVSTSYTILSESPVTAWAVAPRWRTPRSIRRPAGAWLFASGSNYWSNGLGLPGGTDSRIQRGTANVLDRFLVVTATTPPAPPSGLAAAAAPSSSQVDLTWVDNATDETGYVVERSPNGADSWTVVDALPAGSTSYRDSGLTASDALPVPGGRRSTAPGPPPTRPARP